MKAKVAIGLAVLAIIGMVAVKLFAPGSAPALANTKASLAPSLANHALVAQATGVPASTLNKIGIGLGVTPLTRLSGAASLTKAGLPRVVYVGAEYCPFCAAQRWALIGALSRFGTFSHLGLATSSSSDIYPSTRSFSFYGSSYASKYVSFTPVELTTSQIVGSTYQTLQKPTPTEVKLMHKFDAAPYIPQANAGAIPFLDIANHYLAVGSSYTPGLINGNTRAHIARDLQKSTSPVAEGVDGTANMITAAICQTTSQQPSSVCNSPAVQLASPNLTRGPLN